MSYLLMKLKSSIQNLNLPNTYDDFIHHLLASWVESRLGLRTDNDSGRLVRALPKSLTGNDGAGHELSVLTGLPEEICVHALQAILLKGIRLLIRRQISSFAFRLHQFISRGDTVYASVEAEADRHITVYGQKFVPGERDKVLLPLAFCRECGQEYYVVRRTRDHESGSDLFLPRELNENSDSDGGEPGFLYLTRIIPGRKIIMMLLTAFQMIGLKKVMANWLSRKANVKIYPK